jgi:hypothetical protein
MICHAQNAIDGLSPLEHLANKNDKTVISVLGWDGPNFHHVGVRSITQGLA